VHNALDAAGFVCVHAWLATGLRTTPKVASRSDCFQLRSTRLMQSHFRTARRYCRNRSKRGNRSSQKPLCQVRRYNGIAVSARGRGNPMSSRSQVSIHMTRGIGTILTNIYPGSYVSSRACATRISRGLFALGTELTLRRHRLKSISYIAF
jgi:hypothetical protein